MPPEYNKICIQHTGHEMNDDGLSLSKPDIITSSHPYEIVSSLWFQLSTYFR